MAILPAGRGVSNGSKGCQSGQGQFGPARAGGRTISGGEEARHTASGNTYFQNKNLHINALGRDLYVAFFLARFEKDKYVFPDKATRAHFRLLNRKP